jgi:hypothetical protein
MFGMFKSRLERAAGAVEEFIRRQFASAGPLPRAALGDHYCLGFLQGIGLYVAKQALQKDDTGEAKVAFEMALIRMSPSQGPEVCGYLSLLEEDARFQEGTNDAETYLNWSERRISSESEGRRALQRFVDRLRQVAKPPKPAIPGAKPSPGVSWTDWESVDVSDAGDFEAKQDICRTYTFSGMGGPQGTATLTIFCTLGVTILPSHDSISLDRKLRFHLTPFRLPHEADFVMRLSSQDGSKGGEFDIVARPEEPGSNTSVIAQYGGRNDVATCITALRSGTDLIFKLHDQTEGLVSFMLPNDGTFSKVYDQTIEHLQQRAVVYDLVKSNRLQQAPPKTEPRGSLQLRGSKWKRTGGGHEYRLLRAYTSSHDGDVRLEIECIVESSKEVSSIDTRLIFRLKPFRQSHNGSLVVGLFTSQPKGAFVEVKSITVPPENRDDFLDVVLQVHNGDVHKTLRALTAGDEMHFLLIAPTPADQEPCLGDKPTYYARFALENDDVFKELYDDTVERVEVCQDATRARQLGEKWYRRRTPGLYSD